MVLNNSKPKKPQLAASKEDLDLLKSDVASFASSLGLAPAPSSTLPAGFDDSDFRKSGPLKPTKTVDKAPDSSNQDAKPKSKPHPLQINPFEQSTEDRKGVPSYPLMKASSLSGAWYIDAGELEQRVLGLNGKSAAAPLGVEHLKKMVEGKKEVAERLAVQYTREYEASRRKSGEMRLLELTARSGTSADKVSAFTCLVEDNPIANLRSLDALLSMVTSKVGKRYAFAGFDALKELFLSRLLPDCKLKCLFQRPLDSLPETKDGFSLLLFWHWEECLKQRYEKFVIALEEALKDMLPNLKDKAMKTIFILLKSKSEQERRLLTALVNKLGDPERKVASSSAYHLSCLLSAHPNMTAVVIDEVDSFIFRQRVGLRAKYQAVNFLSQILLSKKGNGPKIAKRLLDVYFALFKVLMSESSEGEVHKDRKHGKRKGESEKQKGKKELKSHSSLQNSKQDPSLESHLEMDSRLLSALLTGVNRAFPFVSTDEVDDIVEVQTPVLFRLIHSENFNVGVQALMLLYQISSKNQIASDRFYRALYAKILSPAAVTSSKAELFLGLLVRAMKNDVNLKRVAAFSKRLLQVALQRTPQYACGCLFLLSEVLKAKPPLWSLVLQNECIDDDLEHFEDIIESPEDAVATASSNPINCSESTRMHDSDELPALKCEVNLNSNVTDGFGRGLRIGNVREDVKQENHSPHARSILPAGYSPRHREPLYCNADRTGWWELTILASHVHPSVATMTRTLLSGANIVYNGDPLSDLSLPSFLDKFMEKKPKGNRIAEGKWHGGSQIAPTKRLDLNPRFIGDEILQLAEDEVAPEDVVFHRFYMNKTGSSKKLKTKKKVSPDEGTEELVLDATDESDDEEIDNILHSGGNMQEADEYNYDDLDTIAKEDDEELLGNGSDVEDDLSSHFMTDHPGLAYDDNVDDDNDDDRSLDLFDPDGRGRGVDIDDADGYGGDGSDESDKIVPGEKKRKLLSKSRASPFASLDDYEHLLTEKETKSRPHKSKKTRKNK